jgi:phosphopentomutase
MQPPDVTLLDALAEAGIPRSGVGKVDDLFAGRGITSRHTTDNADGVSAILDWLNSAPRGFCFANLVDFDQLFGHRNDVRGFQGALEAFDRALPSLLAALREDDLLFITADHGNDPTTPSTDHARERVPLLVAGARVRGGSVGERDTFSDLGATVAEWFGLSWRGRGTSFLPGLLHA